METNPELLGVTSKVKGIGEGPSRASALGIPMPFVGLLLWRTGELDGDKAIVVDTRVRMAFEREMSKTNELM